MSINNAEVRHWLDLMACELTSEFDLIEEDDISDTNLAYNRYAQAMIYLNHGYLDAAEVMFRDSIEAYKANDIEDDEDYDDYGYPSGMIFAPYLGLSYCYADRPHEAIEILKEAITVMTKILEDDYKDAYWMRNSYSYAMIELYVEIGRQYVATGNEEMAYYYYERSVEYTKKIAEQVY